MKTKINLLHVLLVSFVLCIAMPCEAAITSNGVQHKKELASKSKKKRFKNKENSKEQNQNIIANASLIAGILGISLTLIGAIALIGSLQFAGIMFGVIGLVTGLMTLFRKDKTKSNKRRGLIGTILGGGVVLWIIIAMTYALISGISGSWSLGFG